MVINILLDILFVIISVFIQASVYHQFLKITYKKALLYTVKANLAAQLGMVLVASLAAGTLAFFDFIEPTSQSAAVIAFLIGLFSYLGIQMIVLKAVSGFSTKKLIVPLLIATLITYPMGILYQFILKNFINIAVINRPLP